MVRPEVAGGFRVRDGNGRPIVWVYGQENPIRPDAMTLDQAEEMALTIATLPEILRESEDFHVQAAARFSRPQLRSCLGRLSSRDISSAMETLSSRAFTRTSAGERFKKPATLATGMPRRSVSPRKNKSAFVHSTSEYSLRNPEAGIFVPDHAPPRARTSVQYKPGSK